MRERENIITFQADPDVLQMVDAVRAANMKLKPVYNEALRRFVPRVLRSVGLPKLGFKKGSSK
jgi:hypothetical protein